MEYKTTKKMRIGTHTTSKQEQAFRVNSVMVMKYPLWICSQILGGLTYINYYTRVFMVLAGTKSWWPDLVEPEAGQLREDPIGLIDGWVKPRFCHRRRKKLVGGGHR